MAHGSLGISWVTPHRSAYWAKLPGEKGGITAFRKQSNFCLFSQSCFSPTTLAEQTSQRGDWHKRSPTSTSVHLAQKGTQMREHLCFIPGAKLSHKSGKMSSLTQSIFSWRSWRCSDRLLLLFVKCCGFICRTWASVEVDHEAFFSSPQTSEERDYISAWEHMCFFWNCVYTKRQKADWRSVWTRFLANVTLCPRTWHRQNCCAHIFKLQQRGLSRENSRKANRDKQKQKE